MIKDLHEIQALILKDLLFHNGSTFSKLNTENLDNNHFTFHIKHLVDMGLVKKDGSKYVLTTLGKQEAGLLDTESLKFERGGKVSVSITCKKQVNGVSYYLIQQRLKEPFFGWWGSISGKVRFGETTEQTAIRELKEEAGLSGKPIF